MPQHQSQTNINVESECDRLTLSLPDIPVPNVPYFGQCAEDITILALLRALARNEGLDLTKQRYLEIGANHPVATSSTYLLNKVLGMKGVLVEANPDLVKICEYSRPSDIVVQTAVVPNDQKTAILHVGNLSELSSISSKFVNAKQWRRIGYEVTKKLKVPALTINELFEKYFQNAEPLFVAIDIEGLDLAVLHTLDFKKWRPFVIQMELSESFVPQAYSVTNALFDDRGYKIIGCTDVNVIAVDCRRLGRQRIVSLDKPQDQRPNTVSEHFLSLVEQCDVVSFDVFDTLISRVCVKPTDIFSYIERRNCWKDFSSNRMAAEMNAANKSRNGGMHETLASIYREPKLSDYCDIGPAVEIEAEKLFVYPNIRTKRMLDICKKKGKRVIAVSDMYLRSNEIKSLLKHCGIELDQVYSSADYASELSTKHNGVLFKKVRDAENIAAFDQMLHIGDNFISDITASSKGFMPYYIQNPLEESANSLPFAAGLEKPARDSSLSFHISAGIIGRWAHLNSKTSTPLHRFGYAYGGPLLLGFIRFLVRVAEADNVNSLYLLARDGAIIEKGMNILGLQSPRFRLIPASRRMLRLPAISSYFERTSEERIKILSNFGFTNRRMTQREFWKMLGLDDPHKGIELKCGDKLVYKSLEAHLAENLAQLTQMADLELEALKAYFSETINFDPQSGAFVDVTSTLHSLRLLNQILECGCPLYVLCNLNRHNQRKKIKARWYYGSNSNEKDFIIKFVPEIEALFSSDAPLCKRFKVNESGKPAVEYYSKSSMDKRRDLMTEEIRRGALEFIEDAEPFFEVMNDAELKRFVYSRWVELQRNPNMVEAFALRQLPIEIDFGNSKYDLLYSRRDLSTAGSLPKKERMRDHLMSNIVGRRRWQNWRLKRRRLQQERWVQRIDTIN